MDMQQTALLTDAELAEVMTWHPSVREIAWWEFLRNGRVTIDMIRLAEGLERPDPLYVEPDGETWEPELPDLSGLDLTDSSRVAIAYLFLAMFLAGAMFAASIVLLLAAKGAHAIGRVLGIDDD